MLELYQLVRSFSDLDLLTGEAQPKTVGVSRTYQVDSTGTRVNLGEQVELDMQQGLLTHQGKTLGQVHSVYSHQLDSSGRLSMEQNTFHSAGDYYVIAAPYYGLVFVMSEEVFNANFIQMFFFDKHDPQVFELVERNPYAALYRLKL